MQSDRISRRRRHLLAAGALALPAAGLRAQGSAPRPAGAGAGAPTDGGTAAARGAPTVAAPSGKPLPRYVEWKHADALIVHSPNTIETRREAFGTSVITPVSILFVRNNVSPPDPSIVEDPDAWRLSLDGVKQPREITLGELRTMGIATLPMVLQCSGNGRDFFPHDPSGTQWRVGAAGCVIWSGVPVRSVVEAMGGVAPGRRFMTGTGGEKLPPGIDPKTLIVERSLPLEAMQDAMLAWELNGAPIPLAHGGPLRLVVPGYTGVNNVKYLKRLAFTERETDARIMATRYRLAPIGEKGDPADPSVQQMSVKSWINSPTPQEASPKAGTVLVHGVAMGGMKPVRRVEVSIDGGRTWRDAPFVGPDLGRYAWRQFALPVELGPGEHVLASRATDGDGTVQPRERVENASGYNNTSWQDHAVKVTVS